MSDAPRQSSRPGQQQRRHCGHELCAVDQGQALLGGERDRLEPGGGEGLGPTEAPSLDRRFALADQWQRKVSERREVAARSDGSSGRDPGHDARVEHRYEQVDRLDTRTRVALCERVRPKQHRGADNLVRVRLADAAGVTAQQPQLELLRLLGRNGLGDEAPESRVDAVGVVADLGLEKRPRCGDAAPALLTEERRPPFDRDLPHIGDRQVLARQLDSVRHAASLVRARFDEDRLATGCDPRGGQRNL